VTTQPSAGEAPVDEASPRGRSRDDTPSEGVPAFAMGDPVPGVLKPGARLVLLGSLIVGWFLLIQRFAEGNVYAVIGPYACIVSVISWTLYSRAIRDWLQPTWRAIWVGFAVGLAMTALTYPAFQLAVLIAPSLDAEVQSLYTGARSTTPGSAFAWVLAIILAEELLFRGAWPATLRNYMSAPAAFGLSVVSYAFAQLGTGSWIVMALASACGTLWTLQRRYTGSLLSPLIAHVIWTMTVFLLYPVT
jgi:membrane protease YdiL (CAAX protease family)